MWDYAAFARALANGADNAHAITVRTSREFEAALTAAAAMPSKMVFIEVIVDRDDCSKELLEWGSRLAANNGRKA